MKLNSSIAYIFQTPSKLLLHVYIIFLAKALKTKKKHFVSFVKKKPLKYKKTLNSISLSQVSLNASIPIVVAIQTNCEA